MNTEFNAGNISSQTEQLYKKLISIYKDFDKKDTVQMLSDEFEKVTNTDKISITFVGQYSSGKSTIIKALTGEDNILIDADIATGEVTPYEWGNSVLLVDTPGVKTGEKEEHDLMTKDAIEHSDLLVYCITSDLFSPTTKNDFILLAEKYRSKLFLMVNKMNAESGEYEDLVESYTDSINKTIAPKYSIVDFYNFFVDAKDYLTGITANDQDYIDDSHFSEFINKLNQFVELRGLKGKLLTPVTCLIDSVDNSLISLETDSFYKEQRILIKKISDVITEKKKFFIKTANSDVQRIANKYINKGDEVAMHLGEKGYKFSNEDFQDFSEPLEEELISNIQDCFTQCANEVDEEVSKIIESEMAQHYFEEQTRRLDKEYTTDNKAVDQLDAFKTTFNNAAVHVTPTITAWLSKAANVSEGAKISIWTVKGSNLHNIVTKVGHAFGYKFKPFQAVKITKKIATIGTKLGPILTGVGVFVEGAMWLVEKLGEKKVRKIKSEIKEVFKEVSEDTLKYYNDEISTAAKEFDTITDCLNDELKVLDNHTSQNNDFAKQLTNIKMDLESLLKRIEG